MRAGSWLLKALAYATAILVSLVCLYPFFWMVVSAFRSSKAILSSPLRPLAGKSLSLRRILWVSWLQIGGTLRFGSMWETRSIAITTASTMLSAF